MIYRGGIGQWSWALHRLTGVGVGLFLLIHIIDTALILLGPDLYNRIMHFYRMPLFALMEMGLFAAVLYHTLNGIRIILIDFFPVMTTHHKRLFAVVVILFIAIFVPVAGIMAGHALEGIRR